MRELGPITDVEIKEFVMHLERMSDYLIFKLLTDTNSSKGYL